jgi:hypothetical protein
MIIIAVFKHTEGSGSILVLSLLRDRWDKTGAYKGKVVGRVVTIRIMNLKGADKSYKSGNQRQTKVFWVRNRRQTKAFRQILILNGCTYKVCTDIVSLLYSYK